MMQGSNTWSCPVRWKELSDVVKNYISPATMRVERYLAARARIPMRPADMVICLFCLLHDPDDEISRAADESLTRLTDDTIISAVSSKLPREVQDYLVERVSSQPEILKGIIKNSDTLVNSLISLAMKLRSSLDLLERLAEKRRTITYNLFGTDFDEYLEEYTRKGVKCTLEDDLEDDYVDDLSIMIDDFDEKSVPNGRSLQVDGPDSSIERKGGELRESSALSCDLVPSGKEQKFVIVDPDLVEKKEIPNPLKYTIVFELAPEDCHYVNRGPDEFDLDSWIKSRYYSRKEKTKYGEKQRNKVGVPSHIPKSYPYIMPPYEARDSLAIDCGSSSIEEEPSKELYDLVRKELDYRKVYRKRVVGDISSNSNTSQALTISYEGSEGVQILDPMIKDRPNEDSAKWGKIKKDISMVLLWIGIFACLYILYRML